VISLHANQIGLKDVVPLLGNLNRSTTERIHHVIQLIQVAEREGEDEFKDCCSVYPADPDTGAFLDREKHRSIKEAVQTLRSSVDCLMRLLPTMESYLLRSP
jgi:hypothetical protein